ncbi:hypothetical protein [Finegoldia magna]|uniref:hypothetical protein n=1 Tax=Finegoldia magna TaxID=1260 RepID=UPI0011D11549|nr:hypothetical protein [Finegoldia magna]
MIFSVNRGNLLFVCYDLRGKEKRYIVREILIAMGEGRRILHNDKQKIEFNINRDKFIVNAKSRRTFLHEYLDYENK